ncbi:MFS transporter [Streptomyces albidoflavus]
MTTKTLVLGRTPARVRAVPATLREDGFAAEGTSTDGEARGLLPSGQFGVLIVGGGVGRESRAAPLLAGAGGAMIAALDATVLLMAQPELRRAFGASAAQLQWASTGYLVAVAALLHPATLAVLRLVYPEQYLRRAVAVRTGAIAVVAGSGPMLGGLLVAHFGRQSVFWINLPPVLAVLVPGHRPAAP